MDLRPLPVRDAVPSLQAIAAQGVQSLAKAFKQDNLEVLASGIPLFLHLLDGTSSTSSSSSSSQQNGLASCAAAALSILAWKDDVRMMLLEAGCVPRLLQTISSSSGSVNAATTPAAKAAAEVVACLALHDDSRAAIVQDGVAGTLLGLIQVLVDHGLNTTSLLGRRRAYQQTVSDSSSDSDLADDEESSRLAGLQCGEAATEVLLEATAAFITLLAESDSKRAAAEGLLQHERGAGLLLDLCKCCHLWWDKDLGNRAQVALFQLVQQHVEFPAALEGFLQAGGVEYLLKLLEDGLDCASDWDDSDDGADEQTMRAVEAAAGLAAAAAGGAALGTPEIVECLLQMSFAGEEQSGECSDHVHMYASLALVRLAADEGCRLVMGAQGGLPGFLQAMVDQRMTDAEVQQRLKDICSLRSAYLAQDALETTDDDYRSASESSESGLESE